MKIETHYSLKNWNTFGVDETAAAFVSVDSVDALKTALSHPDYSEHFILGGGSNLLLTQPLAGLCIHVNLKGTSIVEENEDAVIVEAQAGENWHDFVCWTLEQGYGGLENLSLIPGNVGTAPIQNIGAYGVELKDVFVECSALRRSDLTLHTFDREQAEFDYRSSYFKTRGKDHYVICAVRFRLTKRNHRLATSYGAIASRPWVIRPPTHKASPKRSSAFGKANCPTQRSWGTAVVFLKTQSFRKGLLRPCKGATPTCPTTPKLTVQ